MIWLDDLVAVAAKYLVIFGFAYFGAHLAAYMLGIGG
jgi:hypothetical protein